MAGVKTLRRIGFLIIGFLTTQETVAQKRQGFLKYYERDWEPTIGFNNRRTHIYNEPGTLYGFRFGLNFDKKLKNTLGVNTTLFRLGKPQNETQNFKTTRLWFLSVTEEFRFYSYKKFSAISYVSFGIGWSFQKDFSPQSELLSSQVKTILPIELGLHSEYKLWDWLALKAGGGWRFFPVGHDKGLAGYYVKLGAGVNAKWVISILKAS